MNQIHLNRFKYLYEIRASKPDIKLKNFKNKYKIKKSKLFCFQRSERLGSDLTFKRSQYFLSSSTTDTLKAAMNTVTQ